MHVEGIARIFSPEWIRTVASGLVVLLAMWWVLKAQGFLWRRTVWQTHGPEIGEWAARKGATVRALWTGYEVRGPFGRRRWRGGVQGIRVDDR